MKKKKQKKLYLKTNSNYFNKTNYTNKRYNTQNKNKVTKLLYSEEDVLKELKKQKFSPQIKKQIEELKFNNPHFINDLQFSGIIDINELMNKKKINKVDEEKKQEKRLNELETLTSKIINENNTNFSEKIEDINTLGNIMVEQIKYDKKINPEKYIEIDEAIKSDDNITSVTGLLAKILKEKGVYIEIEKNISNSELSNLSIQMISSGLATQTKYEIHLDFGEIMNTSILLKKGNEKKKFFNIIKKVLSEDLNIDEEDINLFGLKRGSVITNLSVQGREIKPKRIENSLKRMKGCKKVEVIPKVLLEGCKLSPELFDPKGHNKDPNWEQYNFIRGGLTYNPPYGWEGYGFKVIGKYNNDLWLGCDGNPDEWAVGYHGICGGKVLEKVQLIAESQLKKGENQYYKDWDDVNHPGNKVGVGVYLTPEINEVEKHYCDKITFDDKTYKFAFMCRVNPKKIRKPQRDDDAEYWVLNGTADEIRQYRILIKII